MILVDTSIWVEMLNGKIGKRISEEQLFNFVTCGPVLQEVLQGLRPTPRADAFRDDFLALPVLSDPLPKSLFLAASDLYRVGRDKGRTIRSSTDCLIAAIAIENRVPVWHRDRDFDAIATFTALQISPHPR
ncbi:MAG: PIN domain nuclease [Acidobacteriaceae bacterium]